MVLLIDDDPTTNFLHRRVIKRAADSMEVVEALNGEQAIHCLRENLKAGKSAPGYIFLDINMPELDGWGFLEAYRRLPYEWRSNCRLFMLTTSLNPDDHMRARSYAEVEGVLDKIMSEQTFSELLQKAKQD